MQEKSAHLRGKIWESKVSDRGIDRLGRWIKEDGTN